MASRIANEEVAEFIEGIIDLATIKRWEERFERTRGVISKRFAEIWFSQDGSINYLWERLHKVRSPWHIALLTLAARTGRLDQTMSGRLLKTALERIDGPVGRYALVSLLCILLLGEEDEVRRALRRLTKVEAYNPQGTKGAVFVPEFAVKQVFSGIQIDGQTGDLDLGGGYRALVHALVDYCLIGESVEGLGVIPFDANVPNKLVATEEEANAIMEFQFKYCGKRKRRSKNAAPKG